MVSYAVTTVSSLDVIGGWTGTAPDGRPGGMDLLKVALPDQFRTSTIDSINIIDTTLESTGDDNPGIHLLAMTIEIVDDAPGPWEYQVEKLPYNKQTISWDLKSGETFILTGGGFQYKDYVCKNNGQQICILPSITAQG